jgi:hypothetical protein
MGSNSHARYPIRKGIVAEEALSELIALFHCRFKVYGLALIV